MTVATPDPAHDAVTDPDPVPPDDGTQDVSTGMIAGMPWWAALGAALVVVIAFYITCHAAWSWVTGASDTHHPGDWLRLNSIIGMISNLTLVIVGAVFGVAAQGGQTKAAAAVAKNNKQAAQRHHQTATNNRDKAQANKQTALHQGRLVRGASKELTRTRRRLDAMQKDPQVHFTQGSGIRLDHVIEDEAQLSSLPTQHSRSDVVFPQTAVHAMSPQLDKLSTRLDDTAQDLMDQAL